VAKALSEVKIQNGGNEMTKVYCDFSDCIWFDKSVCTNDVISLDSGGGCDDYGMVVTQEEKELEARLPLMVDAYYKACRKATEGEKTRTIRVKDTGRKFEHKDIVFYENARGTVTHGFSGMAIGTLADLDAAVDNIHEATADNQLVDVMTLEEE
jgi:hypothetical protein